MEHIVGLDPEKDLILFGKMSNDLAVALASVRHYSDVDGMRGLEAVIQQAQLLSLSIDGLASNLFDAEAEETPVLDGLIEEALAKQGI